MHASTTRTAGKPAAPACGGEAPDRDQRKSDTLMDHMKSDLLESSI
jgi:hypothetical protein